MSDKAALIFEALGKLDNIYRPQYREAAALLDDLIIEMEANERNNNTLQDDLQAASKKIDKLQKVVEVADNAIHYADGLNGLLITSGYHGKAEALSNRIKKYIEVKSE